MIHKKIIINEKDEKFSNFTAIMNEITLHPRLIENKDWATLLFLLAFILIAITRSVFQNRFEEFSKLIASNKYIKVYRDSTTIMIWFPILLFVLQMISVSFLIQLTLHYFGHIVKFDWISYIRVFTFFSVFVLSKYLIEKIIATAFDIEELIAHINFEKLSYRNYVSMLILPVNCILFYNDNLDVKLFLSFICIILTINLWYYLKSINNYQNLILSNIFYFILYLCTIEIAPYYFAYYWFTKR